jgi:hypothetical protein
VATSAPAASYAVKVAAVSASDGAMMPTAYPVAGPAVVRDDHIVNVGSHDPTTHIGRDLRMMRDEQRREAVLAHPITRRSKCDPVTGYRYDETPELPVRGNVGIARIHRGESLRQSVVRRP